MKSIFILLACFISTECVYAQTQNPEQKQEFLNRINNGLGLGDILYNGSGVQSDVEGDPFLLEYELPGSIMIINGTAPYEVAKMKYHVLNNFIECDYQGRTLAIDGVKVLSFNLAHRYFVNTTKLGVSNNELSGFYEVLSQGNPSLLAHYSVKIKKPDYNVALDIGNKNYRLLKDLDYYFLYDNKIYHISSKKDVLNMMGKKEKDIKNFIRQKSISFSDGKGLKELSNFLNSFH